MVYTAKLILNVRQSMLTAEYAGKRISLAARPGSGLLAQLKPGDYLVSRPVRDPAAGWIATVKLAGNVVGSPIVAKWHSRQEDMTVSYKVNVATRTDTPAFVLSTQSLGGWNDVMIVAGSQLMVDLQSFGTITLHVVF